MGEERLLWTDCSSPVPRSPSRSCRRPVRESDCGNLVRRSRVMRRSHVNRTHPALCAAFIQRTMATADMIRVCGGARVRAAGAGLARCRPVGSAGHDSTSSIEPEYEDGEFGKKLINLDCRCLYFPAPEIEPPHQAQGGGRPPPPGRRRARGHPDKKLFKKNIVGGDEGEGVSIPQGRSSVTRDP